jgi:hypothetical protein
MLADALPDDFGNALIDAWMATKGIERSSITALDRLAYMGKRGMGALEFHPGRGSQKQSATPSAMKALVQEARRLVEGNFSVDHESKAALANIIKVGTSAGGARAKAVITWNPPTRYAADSSMPRRGSSIGCLNSTASAKIRSWELAKVMDALNMPIRSWQRRRASRCRLAGC